MSHDSADFATLVVRALNSSKAIHSPTYAALRVLLQSGKHFQPVFEAFAQRRCLNRASWRYYPFQILKEISNNTCPIYRHCFAGSPITALVETLILKLMSEEQCFAVPPCAFSYLWPKNEMSGRNFAYFFEGYEKRNKITSELLAKYPGHVAVVLDIKAFYPTINKEKLRSKISDRVVSIEDSIVRRSIHQFLSTYLSQGWLGLRGIAIGPDLSHVLGHVALEDVDQVMTQKFGDRYLRYVDDIILVVPASEASGAILFFEELLNREDLESNRSKEDRIDPATWRSESPLKKNDFLAESFDSLFDALTLFLMSKDWKVLQKELRNEGFSIPVNRLRSRAKSVRFWAYFRRKVGNLKWYGSWFQSVGGLIGKAKSVRNLYLARAKAFCHEAVPAPPMRRRWYVQKRRFVLNRLLYLLSPADYGELVACIPEIDEFFELRFLVQVLQSGDATGILKYPGRLVNSLCQLWPERLQPTQLKIDWPQEPSEAEAESAATLAIGLSIFPPDRFQSHLAKNHPERHSMIDCCSGKRPRLEKKTPYLDEMAELLNDIPHHELVELISTRYDEMEDVGLDGLLLGDAVSECWSDAQGYKP